MVTKNNYILYIIIAISLIAATYFYTKTTISSGPTPTISTIATIIPNFITKWFPGNFFHRRRHYRRNRPHYRQRQQPNVINNYYTSTSAPEIVEPIPEPTTSP